MKVALREKGRITIPAEVRKALGLRKGDMLQLSTRHAEIILKPAKVVSAKEIRGIIGRFKVENEEIEEALGRAN